ncbi:hypothetical protein ACP275_07G063500 [Erythranthe tilingii]
MFVAASTTGVPPRCPRDLRPPVTSYRPSMWGDTFSTFSLDNKVQEAYAQSIEGLKKEVRSKLVAATSGELVIIVDTLERLGLAYHFEAEIEEKLEQIYKEDQEYDDLFTTALVFRLLRQHRYQVSCGVFDRFKDGKDEKLNETLIINDVEGLLSLYEAAHVRIHGEDILEEAVTFTRHHLTVMEPKLLSPLKDKVKRALHHPFHKGVTLIEARVFISIYEKDDSRDELVLRLAKLNFNFLQNMYKEEICELSRWWNSFDLKSKLPYARDRLIECYLWGAAFRFEPEYSYVRISVAKNMQMVSIMDDTYDNYATLDEAQLLTDVLDKWDDMNEIARLPEYMKVVYQFIMSIYNDHERDAIKREKSFTSPAFKETVKQLGRAYNQEQNWIMERQMPSFDVYINNSVITSCIYVIFTALSPGMKSVTEETINWLLGEPKIVISTAKMGRHLEDLGSHERENREGKLLTVVDCYMKHHGVSKQEALSKFAELVENAWKDVNKEWATRNCSVPKEMVEQLLNYARVAEVTYKGSEDGYTYPETFLAPQIVALFVDPIVI